MSVERGKHHTQVVLNGKWDTSHTVKVRVHVKLTFPEDGSCLVVVPTLTVCSNVNFTHLFGFFFSYLVQFERSCNYLLLAVCTEWCSGRICVSCPSLICDRWHICHQLGRIGNDDEVAQMSAFKSQKGSWSLDHFCLWTLAGRRMEARHYVNSPAGEQSRRKKRKTCFSGEFRCGILFGMLLANYHTLFYCSVRRSFTDDIQTYLYFKSYSCGGFFFLLPNFWGQLNVSWADLRLSVKMYVFFILLMEYQSTKWKCWYKKCYI